MKKALLIISIFCSAAVIGQENKIDYDTLIASTNYYGKDIFVKNPFDSNGGLGFTCKEVFVNGELVDAAINQSAFGIKLGDRKEGEEITIEIVYTRGSKPDILNLKPNH